MSELRFSPDGRWLASAGASELRLFDGETGQLAESIRVPAKGGCLSVDFSPDGKLLAYAAADCLIYLADRQSRRIRCLGSQKLGSHVRFLPDNRTLLSIDRGEWILHVWDVETGQAVETHRHSSQEPLSAEKIAVGPDGKHVALFGEGFSVWDSPNQRNWTRKVSDSLGGSTAAAFVPQSDWTVAGNTEGQVALRHLASSTPDRVFAAHEGEINDLVVPPDGKTLFTAGDDGFLRVWDVAACQLRQQIRSRASGLLALSLSADGKRLACAGNDGVIHLFQLPLERDFNEFPLEPGAILRADFWKGSRRVITCGSDGILRDWDVQAANMQRTFLEGPRTGECALIPQQALLATKFHTENIRLWDLETGAVVRTWNTGLGEIRSLAPSPDGRFLAVGHSQQDIVSIWELAGGQPIWKLSIEGEVGFNMTLAPDGETLAVGDFDLELWNLRNRKKLYRFDTGWVYSIAFSPAGLLGVACHRGGETAIQMWELASSRQRPRRLWRVEQPEESLYQAIALSPDSRIVACALGDFYGAPSVIQFMWSSDGKLLATLEGHRHDVSGGALKFSPDGQLLLSGSMDTTAIVWDVCAIK